MAINSGDSPNTNIVWHALKVTRSERERLNMKARAGYLAGFTGALADELITHIEKVGILNPKEVIQRRERGLDHA